MIMIDLKLDTRDKTNTLPHLFIVKSDLILHTYLCVAYLRMWTSSIISAFEEEIKVSCWWSGVSLGGLIYRKKLKDKINGLPCKYLQKQLEQCFWQSKNFTFWFCLNENSYVCQWPKTEIHHENLIPSVKHDGGIHLSPSSMYKQLLHPNDKISNPWSEAEQKKETLVLLKESHVSYWRHQSTYFCHTQIFKHRQCSTLNKWLT